MIDTNNIDKDLRMYLQLYIKLIFELPIHNDEVNLSHAEVVEEINKNLLEFDASIGIDGGEFDFGVYPQYAWIWMKVSLKKFETGVKLLKYLTFDSVFDKCEIKVGVEKLLKEITKRKQSPFDLIHSVSNDISYRTGLID
jgi:Zn-dependent M16 (insulinase) family peptidase